MFATFSVCSSLRCSSEGSIVPQLTCLCSSLHRTLKRAVSAVFVKND